MKIRTNYYRGTIQLYSNPEPLTVDVTAPNKPIAKRLVEKRFENQIKYWVKPLTQLPF